MNRQSLEKLLRNHAPEVNFAEVRCACGYHYDASAIKGLMLEKWSQHVADAIYPRSTS